MYRNQHLLVGLTGQEAAAGLIRYAAMVVRLNAPRVVEELGCHRTGANGCVLTAPSSRLAFDSGLAHAAVSNGRGSPFLPKGGPGRFTVNEVRFVQVLPKPASATTTSDHHQAREGLRAEVRAHFHGVPDDVPVGCDVLKGPPIERLLEFAAEQENDVLLAGPSTGSAGRRFTAGRLAMHAPCSVWLVPPDSPPLIRRILVPVDFSERSADSLRVAAALAQRGRQAKCLALHVYFNEAAATYEGYDQELRRQQEKAFEEFIARIDCQGVPVEPLFVEGSKVAHVITRVADKHAVDLVVMTTRGRTPSAALVLGSVTEQTIIKARVPLLVVKQSGSRLGLLQALWDKTFCRKGALQFN